MRTRDAIVGTETIRTSPAQDAALDTAARLRRMDAQFRQAVLVSELLEDIAFQVEDYPEEGYDPPRRTARSVTVQRRAAGDGTGAAQYRPLATIIRPEVQDFAQATPLVAAYAELRADRAAEILVQKEHLIPFAAAILPITPARTPAVIEMLETGLALVTPVVMRVKIALGCPRPSQFSDRIQPMIPEPGHPTLPSGHAMQMFTVATMLTLLAEPASVEVSDSQLYRLACRIAINRTVAGVHFPADSAAGAVLGIQLGRYLMARGQEQAGTVGSARFDGTRFHDRTKPRDFHSGILARMMTGGDPSTTFPDDAATVRPAPLWQSLCKRAGDEWQTRWS
ncbi:phosphatase PAP2 family protein [Paracoccus sp. (in: a-proteobacteria)]|uniref:phosphatase PAP2 family protein n=1 Tax=Paracoccus sp. TaxID=267 RepID=UPI0035AF474B